MAFFDQFVATLGQVDEAIMQPPRDYFSALDFNDPMLKARTDYTLAEGKFIPIIYHGKVINAEIHERVQPILESIGMQDIPCLRNNGIFKMELSVVPPGGSLNWHHDIYVKDKTTERIHVPIITNPETVFLAKWFSDPRIYGFRMKQDMIYRLNNRVPHMVRNGGGNIRYHLLINYMRLDLLAYLRANPPLMDEIDPVNWAVRPGSNAWITPSSELYYYVNHDPKGAELMGMIDEQPIPDQRLNQLLRNTRLVNE